MKPKAFIFIGQSGCGKGTQAKLLVDYLKSADNSSEPLYIQTGQEFRDFIKGESYTQQLSKKMYEEDKLQPEFLSVYMWINVLVRNYSGTDHIIFDGAPRRRHEAGVLDSIFSFYNIAKPFVIHMDVGEDWARKRLTERKRMDDDAEGIERRLQWFKTDVIPAIDFYRGSENYHFIDIFGERPIEDVHKDIVSKIGSLI